MQASQNSSDVDPTELSESCPSHGLYISRVVADFAGLAIRSDCPVCAKERKAEARSTEYRERVDLAAREANVPPRYRSSRLDRPLPAQARAADVLRRYVANFEHARDRGSAPIMVGPPGGGKTWLGAALVQELQRGGYRAKRLSVLELMAALRSSWRHASKRSHRELVLDLVGLDLVVLDDVGAQVGNELELACIFEVVDARYSAGNAPTAVISNLPAEQLQAFLGERTWRRLSESGFVVVVDQAAALTA